MTKKQFFADLATVAFFIIAGAIILFLVLVGIQRVAEGQGVTTQGLPARYIPAFTGAGIDTTALLGPHCKSASKSGSILTITCEDDDDPTTPDAVTTFTDTSVTSAALSGATATFTKSDATTFDLNLSGLGGGGNPQAIVDITFDQSENTLTFTRVNADTFTCNLAADCPAPAPITIYGAVGPDATFAGADFMSSDVGSPPTQPGPPPATITFAQSQWDGQTDTDVDTYMALALPAAVTLTGVEGIANDNLCVPSWGFDCSSGTDVEIAGNAYRYYILDAGEDSHPGEYLITWSE